MAYFTYGTLKDLNNEESGCKLSVMSSAEDPELEGLTIAEENAERLEAQTAESPRDSPPPVARVRARLRQRLMTQRSEDRVECCPQKHPVS